MLGPSIKKLERMKQLATGGCEGEMGHGGQVEMEVMRKQRVKKTRGRKSVVPCGRQDHVAPEVRGAVCKALF